MYRFHYQNTRHIELRCDGTGTAPGTEFARDFCAGIALLQLGVVLVFFFNNNHTVELRRTAHGTNDSAAGDTYSYKIAFCIHSKLCISVKSLD